jgi:hypothetical protein
MANRRKGKYGDTEEQADDKAAHISAMPIVVFVIQELHGKIVSNIFSCRFSLIGLLCYIKASIQ